MKRLFFILIFLFGTYLIQAQQTYTVDGKEYTLKTEIDGNLDLLWNIIDGQYRYFIRKEDGTIIELKNTKESRKFKEEYKEELRKLITTSTNNIDKLDLTLYDLGVFVDDYNQAADSNYNTQIEKIDILLQLEGFVGISNSPFVYNTEDAINPQFGLGLELIDLQTFPRHALYLNARHVLKSDKFEYSLTELALGYRFRIIDKSKFSFYTNIDFGTLSFFKSISYSVGPADEPVRREAKETEFQSPFKFGVGADFKISDNSFLVLRYNELFALLVENAGNFSKNISLGYKVNL
ncbi:hypothetical protein SAMN03097699_3061 [Flavobacteriaceae bacterium MAR_2010_188]|nr:hypothetical protein SAMN03097699_3061 [Flavobacteriaceae bacterium MAR_2010_188]